MKVLLAFLARKVCFLEVIKVAGELRNKKINLSVPFRLIGAQGFKIWNTSPVIEAYK